MVGCEFINIGNIRKRGVRARDLGIAVNLNNII